MAYKIIVTESFKTDLNEIMEYISHKLQSQAAAKHLLESTEKSIDFLKDNPFLYPLYHDEKLAEKGYHYAVVSNYLMFYTFNEAVGEVRLMRFLYGGQNIVSML